MFRVTLRITVQGGDTPFEDAATAMIFVNTNLKSVVSSGAKNNFGHLVVQLVTSMIWARFTDNVHFKNTLKDIS